MLCSCCKCTECPYFWAKIFAMSIKTILTFHIAVPVFFGLSAIGTANAGIYAPAFLCALFCALFTQWGWRVATKWLQLPGSFYRFRWWCVAGAFVVYSASLSLSPDFRAQKAKAEAKTEALMQERKRTIQIAREAAEAKRKAEHDPFAKHFSAWDNSCLPVVAAVKTRLKDPGSFQHIKTGFYRAGDVVHVTMSYRAKNSFGGYAPGEAKADVSADGKVSNLSVD